MFLSVEEPPWWSYLLIPPGGYGYLSPCPKHKILDGPRPSYDGKIIKIHQQQAQTIGGKKGKDEKNILVK